MAPNLFPRNSCQRIFSAGVMSRRFLPIFAFQNVEMSEVQLKSPLYSSRCDGLNLEWKSGLHANGSSDKTIVPY
jgi:hypothetical protein